MVVRVADQHLNPLFAEALLADGLVHAEAGYAGLSVNARLTTKGLLATVEPIVKQLRATEVAALSSVTKSLGQLTPSSPSVEFSYIERVVRPLRIVDAPLDTWLVPIKPHWSAQLFNSPADRFGQIPQLGMSMEHVYYRAAKSGEAPPARVVWWVSGPSAGYAIACSDLVEVIDGSDKELFRRFRRLGVWRWEDVSAAERDGQLRALRFINTEMFDRTVPLRLIEKRIGRKLRLAFPIKVSPAIFDAIITEARQ